MSAARRIDHALALAQTEGRTAARIYASPDLLTALLCETQMYQVDRSQHSRRWRGIPITTPALGPDRVIATDGTTYRL